MKKTQPVQEPETIEELEQAYEEARKRTASIEAALQAAKEAARKAKLQAVVDFMKERNISFSELAAFVGTPLPTRAARAARGTAHATTKKEKVVKYVNITKPSSEWTDEDTWSGKGKPPSWIKDKEINPHLGKKGREWPIEYLASNA